MLQPAGARPQLLCTEQRCSWMAGCWPWGLPNAAFLLDPCSLARSLLQSDEAYVCQLALGSPVKTSAKPCPRGTTPLKTTDEDTGDENEM